MFKRSSVKSQALSTNKQNQQGCLIAFGSIFALVGGIFLYFFFIVPIFQWVMAQSWEPVDCTIVESYVGEHRSDDGFTYSVNIRYTYEFDGRIYKGDRYNFIGGSSSGRQGKQRIVDQYPPGSVRTCHVNPSSPDESVITVAFQWSYLMGLFGGIFLLVGLAIMFSWIPGMKSGRGTWRDVAKAQLGVQPDALEFSHADSATLKPSQGPWTRLLIILLIVGVWDAVVVGIALAVWSEGFGGPWIFLFIFGGIGFFLTLLVPYQILAMLNPRPELTLTPGLIPLGGLVQLEWRFVGGTQRLQNLHIEVAGVEEATYRQGTDTRTAKSTFFRQEIVSVDNPVDLMEGRAQFVIPPDTMHTFAADNNKIKWSIRLKSDIPMWPDVSEEFPIVVRPLFKHEWENIQNAVYPTGE